MEKNRLAFKGSQHSLRGDTETLQQAQIILYVFYAVSSQQYERLTELEAGPHQMLQPWKKDFNSCRAANGHAEQGYKDIMWHKPNNRSFFYSSLDLLYAQCSKNMPKEQHNKIHLVHKTLHPYIRFRTWFLSACTSRPPQVAEAARRC